MRTLTLSLFMLLLASCSANAHVITNQPLALIGDSLPPIRHITEMKAVADTLWFVYETEVGFGQRFLRKAVIDRDNNTLDVEPELGRKSDGYFIAYMPYPTIDIDGNMQVVNQEDGEIFICENDSVLIRSKNYILSSNSTVPIQLSQYVQDISSVSPHNYVFIGREPNGSEQYAMRSNTYTAEIDTIRKIQLSPELTTWLPNTGELAYSTKYDRLAFAYRLHPIIELYGMDGKLIKQVRIGQDSFNPASLEEADFEKLNPLHIVDISATPGYIYALHWNFKYANAMDTAPTIFKIDWDGKIIDRIFNVPMPLYKIAVIDDNFIIGWNGKDFIRIDLPIFGAVAFVVLGSCQVSLDNL